MTFPTKTYEVIATLLRPSALGGNVSCYEFYAHHAADAIKQARRAMSNDGHTRQDGPVEYRARRIKD
jgi:hypothetical protein